MKKAYKNKILFGQRKMNCFCVVVIPNKLEVTDNVPQISLEKATDRQVIIKWINYNTLAR